MPGPVSAHCSWAGPEAVTGEGTASTQMPAATPIGLCLGRKVVTHLTSLSSAPNNLPKTTQREEGGSNVTSEQYSSPRMFW